MLTLIEYYYQQAKEISFREDMGQLSVIKQLQTIGDSLIAERHNRDKKLAFLRQPKLVKGLYLWGNVGIGKTFLMDCFYEWLPFSQKKRIHFHAFMRLVHQALKDEEGQKDPLIVFAKKLAQTTQVLCFDELYVNDIVDAMVLANLFDALFKAGVTLVCTSNAAPDDLYQRGLLRERFLPAIELIKSATKVIHLTTDIDYRLRHLQAAGVFFLSKDNQSESEMTILFKKLTEDKILKQGPIDINGRSVEVGQYTDDMAWFEFNVLCHIPRSQKDYLTITDMFRTIFLDRIPIIKENDRNSINLFIKLVDILYDTHTRLVFSAETNVLGLYPKGELKAQYARTCSRLIEMQSALYYLSHH